MDRRQMVRRAFAVAAGSLFADSRRAGAEVAPNRWERTGALIQKLIDDAEPGSTVTLPAASSPYDIAHHVVIDKPRITLDGGGGEIRQMSPTSNGLVVTAPDVKVRNLSLRGPGLRFVSRDRRLSPAAVSWIGKREAYLSGPSLTNVKMSGWTYGLLAKYCESALVADNSLRDIVYAGMMFESSRNCTIRGTLIRNITGRPNAYGIAVSRETGSASQHPVSTGFEICGNRISDIPYWEAIDTHAGQDIEIHHNNISNVRIGLMITYSEGFAPQRCSAHHNIVRAGSATPQTGAEIVGLPTQQAVDCSLHDNTIDGFGTTGSINGGSVRVQYADNARVVANRITNSLQSALVLFGTTTNVDVSENVIIGVDATVGAYIAAVKVPGGRVTGRIAHNHIQAGIAAGIRSYAPQRIEVQENEIITQGRHYHPDLSYFLAR